MASMAAQNTSATATRASQGQPINIMALDIVVDEGLDNTQMPAPNTQTDLRAQVVALAVAIDFDVWFSQKKPFRVRRFFNCHSFSSVVLTIAQTLPIVARRSRSNIGQVTASVVQRDGGIITAVSVCSYRCRQ